MHNKYNDEFPLYYSYSYYKPIIDDMLLEINKLNKDVIIVNEINNFNNNELLFEQLYITNTNLNNKQLKNEDSESFQRSITETESEYNQTFRMKNDNLEEDIQEKEENDNSTNKSKKTCTKIKSIIVVLFMIIYIVLGKIEKKLKNIIIRNVTF